MAAFKKKISITPSDDLTPAIHGNVIFPFHTLVKVGSYFIEADIRRRTAIHSAVRNYNKMHSQSIKVSTKIVQAGLLVTRSE